MDKKELAIEDQWPDPWFTAFSEVFSCAGTVLIRSQDRDAGFSQVDFSDFNGYGFSVSTGTDFGFQRIRIRILDLDVWFFRILSCSYDNTKMRRLCLPKNRAFCEDRI